MNIDSSNEILDSVIKLNLIANAQESKMFLHLIESKIKRLEYTINSKLQEEPPKLLKSKHKIWEQELEELQSKLTKAYIDLEEETKEHMDTLNFIQND